MKPAKLWQCPSLTLAGDLTSAMIERLDVWIHDQLKAEQLPAVTSIMLTSGGGSNAIGRGLYDRLHMFQGTLNIHLVGLGMVGSAALYISLAVPRKRRFLTANSTVFMHQMQQDYGIPYKGSLSTREHHILEIESDLEHQRLQQAWMVRLIAHEMKQRTPVVDKLIAHQTYFSAHEAVREKLFGSILRPPH